MRFILPLLIIILFFSLAIFRISCEIKRDERECRRYEKILMRDPTNIKALLRCAKIYYQRALRGESDAETIEFFDKAIEYYRRSIALDEDRIPSTAYLHLGIAYFKKSLILKGDYFYREAEVALKEALSKDPLLREGHLYLGHLYYKQNRKRKAYQEYKRAERLGLSDPTSIFNLAWHYKDNGEYGEATKLFERFVKMEGLSKRDLLKARIALGWLYYNKQRFKDSLEQYNKALELDGSSLMAYYWLGKVYKAMGNKEASKRHFQKVLKIDPNHKAAKEQLKLVTEK